MADNLPDNLSDVEDEYIVGEDSRAMQLTHYVSVSYTHLTLPTSDLV